MLDVKPSEPISCRSEASDEPLGARSCYSSGVLVQPVDIWAETSFSVRRSLFTLQLES